jgi:WhiB family redox-sensing transcriptional regulator
MHGENPHERRARESLAKRICAECPVRQECLEYALRVREPFGIWGGLNETERRTLVD